MCPRRRDHEPGPTAAAELVDQIRARILDGDPPPGTPLREEDLAQRYDVSRHTVRAALTVLTAERLVHSSPYRGTRVAELDDTALLALQDLRGALETEAVRILRATHGTNWPDEITAPMRTALDRLGSVEASDGWPTVNRAHSAVHQALVAAAGSPRITQAYTQLDSEILLLLTHIRPDYPAGTLTVEHRNYLTAVQQEGGAAVRAHLAHSTTLIQAARQQAPTTP